MKQEPIAWMSPDGKVSTTEGKLFYKPLYLHQYKELSDEEIMEISHKALEQSGFTKETNYMVVFARAIIKASRGEE